MESVFEDFAKKEKESGKVIDWVKIEKDKPFKIIFKDIVKVTETEQEFEAGKIRKRYLIEMVVDGAIKKFWISEFLKNKILSDCGNEKGVIVTMLQKGAKYDYKLEWLTW